MKAENWKCPLSDKNDTLLGHAGLFQLIRFSSSTIFVGKCQLVHFYGYIIMNLRNASLSALCNDSEDRLYSDQGQDSGREKTCQNTQGPRNGFQSGGLTMQKITIIMVIFFTFVYTVFDRTKVGDEAPIPPPRPLEHL